MPDEVMQAWEAMPQETKNRLMDWVKRVTEAIMEAARAIVKAISEALRRFVETIAPALPPRFTAQIEAARVEWRARGPRRNRALIHAILIRERGHT